MELIAIYIEDFNGISESFINLSSKFNAKYEMKRLTITRDINRDKYYDFIPSTLLIGQNGTGKTTILTFIEDFHYDNDNSGFILWFSGDEFYITSKGSHPSEISSPYETKIIQSGASFFIKNNLFTIKSNNTVDFNAYLFGSRKGTARNFIDISLSNTGRTKHNKKQEISKIFNFINYDNSLSDTLNKEKLSILARLSLAGSERTNKILKDHTFRRKHEEELVCFFNDNYSLYRNRLSHDVSYDKNYQFINPNHFNSYVSFKKENWGLSFFSFMFSKEINNRNAGKSIIEVLFFVLISILYPFSKKLGFEKEDADLFYLKMVITTFFSNEGNFIYGIESLIKDSDYSIKDNYNHSEELYKLEKNIRITFSIIYKLFEYQDKIYIERSDLNFLISSPRFISDLIGMSNSLPKEFDAIFSLEWNGLSSGEVSLLHLFSSLYSAIKSIDKTYNEKSVLLLLDEIDLYLHPEWQRKIFSDILDMLKRIKSNIKFQIIMSSHSPIVASDFLPVDIISLSRGHDRRINVGNLDEIGFGESIEKTMSQGFFLKATVGDRVLKKIEELINRKDDKYFLDENKYITSLIKNKMLKYMLGIEK